MDKLRKNPSLTGYINHVKQTANLLHAFQNRGLPGQRRGRHELQHRPGRFRRAPAAPAATIATGQFSGEALNDASAFTGMEQLASSTGGRAFTTNDIGDALRKIVHDSDVYYTVGYAPTDSAEDGSFRRIDVKVSGGKYKLAYRQGYNASEPGAAPAENPIAPLLQLGIPNATGIYYGASVREQRPRSESTRDEQASLRNNTRRPEPPAQWPAHPLHRLLHHPRPGRLLRPGAQRRAHRQTSPRRQGLRRKRRCAQLAGHAGSRRALLQPSTNPS